MHTSIREILEQIEKLNTELRGEYDRLAEKYGFELQKKKVIFLDYFRSKNKSEKIPLSSYIIPRNTRHLRYLISLPFIFGMIIPTIFLDLCLFIYQNIAFRLYHIPLVHRSDYVIFERRFLDYLNILEQLDCLYCSYVNGVFAFAVEVGARTERYWCPIKAAHKPKFTHGWYKDFADYGNAKEWREKWLEEGAFIDAYGDKVILKNKS